MLVLPLFWVHFVLAHAICVSCALFLHKYHRKKIYIYYLYEEDRRFTQRAAKGKECSAVYHVDWPQRLGGGGGNQA